MITTFSFSHDMFVTEKSGQREFIKITQIEMSHGARQGHSRLVLSNSSHPMAGDQRWTKRGIVERQEEIINCVLVL